LSDPEAVDAWNKRASRGRGPLERTGEGKRRGVRKGRGRKEGVGREEGLGRREGVRSKKCEGIRDIKRLMRAK
jgi:hypothetical protein